MSNANDSDMQLKTVVTEAEAKSDIDAFLPKVSKARYLKVYQTFMKWREDRNEKSFSETVLMKYFGELSNNASPATVINTKYILTCVVDAKHNTNIKKYKKLDAFIKKQVREGENKIDVVKAFTAEHVESFINYAPDEIHLVTKVVLILGISGACSGIELINITTDDVKKEEQGILIHMRDKNGRVVRAFTIRDEFARYVERYQSLRPENLETNRFFLKYKNGKCINQPMGKEKVTDMAKMIARYLRLTNVVLYTSLSFRKTAENLAKSGDALSSLKRPGEDIEMTDEKKITKIENGNTDTINIRVTQPRPATATSKDLESLRKVRKPSKQTQHKEEENHSYCPVVDRKIQSNIEKENSGDDRIDTSQLRNRYMN